MEFYNRRLLLLNEDVPIPNTMPPLHQIQAAEPTAANSSSPSRSMPFSSSTFRSPLQLPMRPIFTSNVAYTFLVLFSALFFLAFILLSIREYSFRRSRRNPPFRGADVAAVKSLQVCSYRGDATQPDCVICLEEFRDCDAVKMIPYCGHVFHPECIDTWLSAHVTCPICRCVLRVGIGDEHVGGSIEENVERRGVG